MNSSLLCSPESIEDPAVRERVVDDLGVPRGAFAATDLVVTMEALEHSDGTERRLGGVEEVRAGDGGVGFAPLYERGDDSAAPTGRIARGDSRAVAALARDGESYAEARAALDERADWLADLAAAGETAPGAVAAAHAERRP